MNEVLFFVAHMAPGESDPAARVFVETEQASLADVLWLLSEAVNGNITDLKIEQYEESE